MANKPKRLKTYYGIPIPPWHDEPNTNSYTMVFVLNGKVPSKKNELVAVVDRNDAFAALDDKQTFTRAEVIALLWLTYGRIINSKSYQEWENAAVATFQEQLQIQLPTAQSKGLVFPISKASVKIRFYWRDKHRRDNSNKSEGIHDALVKAQVLLDDGDRVMPDTDAKARDYSNEVVNSIAVIYITIPLNVKGVTTRPQKPTIAL